MSNPFEQFDDEDVAALIRDYPLAWVIAPGGGANNAALLPLLADRDEQGRVIGLVGHMAKRNPLFATLSRAAEALILFQGPQAYVSPELVPDRNWGPTWNYAHIRIEANIRFLPGAGDEALDRLVGEMESGRAVPWHRTELGQRYRGMEQAIIAFQADVTRISGLFKLGQDERPEMREAIIAGHPDRTLARWMHRMNGSAA